MKFARWFLSFPVAFVLSFIAWTLSSSAFEGIASIYGGGFFQSVIGLTPILVRSAIPTSIFVVTAIMIAPSHSRKVCFVFFVLSLLLSGGGIELLRFQEFSHIFWLAGASGVVIGALIGLAFALRIQERRKPNQPVETTQAVARPARLT